MKKRVRKIANFFAFNLLFFALYLNFIHKDDSPVLGGSAVQAQPASFNGTVIVDNPEVNGNKGEAAVADQKTVASASTDNTAPLKLSIN